MKVIKKIGLRLIMASEMSLTVLNINGFSALIKHTIAVLY